MPKVKTVKLKTGEVRYRFTVDVTPRDPKTGKRVGSRDQEHRSFERADEAERELARITREVALGVYVKRLDPSTLRSRALVAGKIPAEDLFRSGQCTPNCMHAWNERYVKFVGCACPCRGVYHGVLRGVAVTS